MKLALFKRSADPVEQKPKRKKLRQVLAGAATAAVMMCCGAMSCFAAEGETVVSASDWQSVIDAITAQISVQTIVGVLAVVVAACVGLAFMWWGLRKAINALMGAFKKGKVTV